MDGIVSDCKYLGKLSARRYVNSFAGIILAQYFFTQWGTYYAFSWDIIEPIACCMTLSDAFIAYLFWLKTGCPWDIIGLQEHFRKKKMERAIYKQRFNT